MSYLGLNGVIDNYNIKIGKTLDLYETAADANARRNVKGSVSPQMAIAYETAGFSGRPQYHPAVSIRFNQIGKTGYWAWGWINTADNLPLAEPSTVVLQSKSFIDAATTIYMAITPKSAGVVHDVTLQVFSSLDAKYQQIKKWTNVPHDHTWDLSQAEVRLILGYMSHVYRTDMRVIVETKLDGTSVGTTTSINQASPASTIIPYTGDFRRPHDLNPKVTALGLTAETGPTHFVLGASLPAWELSGHKAGQGAFLKSLVIQLGATNPVTLLTHAYPPNHSGGTSESYPFELPSGMTGNQAIIKILTNTRGIESNGITTIYILEYQPPTMTGLQVRRASDTSGTLDEAGEYIRIDVNTKRSELNRRGTQTDYNPTTMKVYAKKSGDDTSTLLDTRSIPAGSSNQSYTITTPISETSTYEVQVVLEDKLNAVGQTVTLPTQKVPFSIGKDEGIGVGKIWEAGALDISSEGGVAIDGVLKKPWPWLANLGTLVDGTDFNALDDGFYLNSGYTDVFNAPPVSGVLMQFTGLDYIAQFVIGIHEMAWRLKTVVWMPWQVVWSVDTSEFVTEAKTVEGAINELKEKIDTLETNNSLRQKLDQYMPEEENQ